MKCGFKFLSAFLFLSVGAVGSSLAAPFEEGQRVGLEFEFDGAGPAKDPKNIEPWLAILNLVAAHVGGSSPEFQRWPKSFDQNLRYGYIIDSQNRKWSLEPEIMSSSGEYDGYELVVPPLEGPEDGKNLKRILNAIKRSKLLVRGYSSATQFTYDLSPYLPGFEPATKLDSNLNVSSAIDALIFLENHMPEIYSILGPKRYDRVINHYSVPLALNQKELLYELSNLSPIVRTYKNVHNLFLKYHQRELDLVSNKPIRAWKFRSVHYGKFFIPKDQTPLPVFEFRIPDLIEPSDSDKNNELGELDTTEEFLRRLLAHAASSKGVKFLDPFPGFNEFKSDSIAMQTLDKQIREVPVEKRNQLLIQLGLNPKDYPLRYKIEGPFKRFCRWIAGT